jgi:hypothetical protein
VIDAMFLIVLVKKIKPGVFRGLKFALVVSSGLYWAALWTLMVSFF